MTTFSCPAHQIQATGCPSLLNCSSSIWEPLLCFLTLLCTETPYFPASSLPCFLDLQIFFRLLHVFPKVQCPTPNKATQPRPFKGRGVWKDYFMCLETYILFYTIFPTPHKYWDPYTFSYIPSHFSDYFSNVCQCSLPGYNKMFSSAVLDGCCCWFRV